MSTRITFNGKFLAGPKSGVQRVATEMIRAVDEVLQGTDFSHDMPDIKLRLPNGSIEQLELKKTAVIKAGLFTGKAWEQIDLPRLAKGSLIVNLANLGPVLASNAITMIHDAQTFSAPDSYSLAFRSWYAMIQPILARRNHRILTVSEFSKRELARYGVAELDKIEVIHNGVDHIGRISSDARDVQRLKLRPGKFVLGLANTQPHKNVMLLLHTFADPRLKDIDLVLFGSAELTALEQFAGAKLTSNVKLAGTISDARLIGLMKSALCLAFPSRTEGFGLPPLEAMFIGCPAIVAPCGALPEVCGAAALYADPDVVDQWVAHIKTLSEDPAIWSKYCQTGKDQASKFRWRNSAMRLLDICNSLT